MAILEVMQFPHNVLRQVCEDVENITGSTQKLIQDMAETMYAYKGIGLAAPQIGILKKIIVLDTGEGLISVINPHIVESEGLSQQDEGCLCLPELYVPVERKERVRISGVSLKGKPVSIEADGLLARALQHEIDHLHGVLIIDKLSKLKRDMIIKKFRKNQLKAHK